MVGHPHLVPLARGVDHKVVRQVEQEAQLVLVVPASIIRERESGSIQHYGSGNIKKIRTHGVNR